MSRIWIFCKKCEMYHIDFKSNDLDRRAETHLTPSEVIDAKAFPSTYLKEIEAMPGACIVFVHREAMPRIIRHPKLKSGVFEKNVYSIKDKT